MKLAFLWFGFDGRYGMWQDGLYAAMKVLQDYHDVRFFDVSPESLLQVKQFNPDVVLFWEAPCTKHGKDGAMWNSVVQLPYRKCLLFAGGPLKAIDVAEFDMVFVESAINAEECERQGIPHTKAFGVNTNKMYPKSLSIRYDAMMQATFADWKRHDLFADAMGNNGLVCGRKQEFDRNGYDRCVKRGVHIMDEQPAEKVCDLINSSWCVLNTSNAQGGGQRSTVEGMACAMPVIVMSDSPKNCEFIQASGGGVIADPNVESIREAVAKCKEYNEFGTRGYEYIQSHLTERHYAWNIMKGILSI